jgi:hypothetical protein
MDFDKLDFEAIEKPVSLFSLSLKRTNNNKKKYYSTRMLGLRIVKMRTR